MAVRISTGNLVLLGFGAFIDGRCCMFSRPGPKGKFLNQRCQQHALIVRTFATARQR
jgi:hypothetical protein